VRPVACSRPRRGRSFRSHRQAPRSSSYALRAPAYALRATADRSEDTTPAAPASPGRRL
jgi:hypothetical protein